jgi:hypothetical protein
LDTSVSSLTSALHSLEQHLQALQDDLQRECEEYGGYSHEELVSMLLEQVVPVLDKIRADASQSVTHACVECQAQLDGWTDLVANLSKFSVQCSTQVQLHAERMTQMASNAQMTFDIMLRQFDVEHAQAEDSFNQLLERIGAAASEEELADISASSMDHLASMESGYHSAKRQAASFVVGQVDSMQEANQRHREAMCQMLCVQLQEAARSAQREPKHQAGETDAEARGSGQHTLVDKAAGWVFTFTVGTTEFVASKDLYVQVSAQDVQTATEQEVTKNEADAVHQSSVSSDDAQVVTTQRKEGRLEVQVNNLKNVKVHART